MSLARHILMGHRLSKTPVNGCNAYTLYSENNKSQNRQHSSLQITEAPIAQDPIVSVQIPNSSSVAHEKSNTKFLDAPASTQIIIKIQLTKMEEQDNTACNKKIGQKVLNFNGNCSELNATDSETSRRTSMLAEGISAGSPSFLVNNNFTPNVIVTPMCSTNPISENFNIVMGPMTDLEKRMSIASMVSNTSSNNEIAADNTSSAYPVEQHVIRTSQGLFIIIFSNINS